MHNAPILPFVNPGKNSTFYQLFSFSLAHPCQHHWVRTHLPSDIECSRITQFCKVPNLWHFQENMKTTKSRSLYVSQYHATSYFDIWIWVSCVGFIVRGISSTLISFPPFLPPFLFLLPPLLPSLLTKVIYIYIPLFYMQAHINYFRSFTSKYFLGAFWFSVMWPNVTQLIFKFTIKLNPKVFFPPFILS